MGASRGTVYPIRSVDRVCDILDALANASSEVTLTDMASSANLPKSSALRYLTALEARHYVERVPNAAAYRLGPAFRPQYKRRVDQLTDFATPILEQLRDRLNETTNLGVLDGVEVLHAAVYESRQMMRLSARVGDRGPVHSTALGKAMCATLSDERVLSILDAAGMPPLTDATITKPEAFLDELRVVRARGYAVDDCENQPDGRCLAVCIDGLPFPAGISMSAPINRFPQEEVPSVAKILKRAANQIKHASI